MWLFTKQGFLSVVQDREDATQVLVRGRVREDLERFLHVAYEGRHNTSIEDGKSIFPQIMETPEGDYRFRVTVPRQIMEDYLTDTLEDLDYFNFKSEVHGEPARDKAYMRCWSAMNDLQQDHVEREQSKKENKKEFIGGKFIGG
jgi:hypothetical protein